MKATYSSRSMIPIVAAALALLAMTATPASAAIGTGGTITYTDSTGVNPVSTPPFIGGYVVHTFTSTGTFTPPSGGCTANVLVVAGGGGGGSGSGGGGGAGGMLYQTGLAVSGSTTVTIGSGGAGGGAAVPSAGQNSVFGTITAKGGGYGGQGNAPNIVPGTGGSGGGGVWNSTAGASGTAGPPVQGYAGGIATGGGKYAGGGGGGAGTLGGNVNGTSGAGGNGGNGTSSSISGSAVTYAGGGAGGADSSRSGTGGTGGTGGGGNGSTGSVAAQAGLANTGGGGGGGANSGNSSGAAGGSGIVIVRYPYVNSPVVLTLNPAKSATVVAVNSSLVVTFNQNVLANTGNIFIKQTSDDSVLQTIDVTSAQVTVSGATATIIPPSSLPFGTSCYVQIDAGAFTATADSTLFAGITDKTTWSFKTAGGAPIISTLNPANNATGSPDTGNLVVTFDQAVQKGSGNIVILRTSDNNVLQMIDVTSLPVTVSGAVATIPLAGNLPLGTPCYVQIAAGAFSSTADSSPFAGIADTVTWRFTTVGLPSVLTLNPANNSIGAGVGSSLVVTFNENVQQGTGNIVILKTSDNSVIQTIDVTSGQVTVSGTTATINHSAFPASTQCYVQIAAGAFTAAVGSMPAFAGITDTTTWSFTTGIYNFTFTPTAASTYAWTSAANWTNGVPASATNATVTFFTNTTTALGNGSLTVNNDPAALTLNTLTLNGKGADATAQTTVNIGTAGKTWTFDGTNPTININAMNGTQAIQPVVLPNIALNQNLTITGNGTASNPTLSGNISELQSGGSLMKSGSSNLALTGVVGLSGGLTLSAGTLNLTNSGNSSMTAPIALNGGSLQAQANNALGTGDITLGANASMGSSFYQNGTVISVQNNVKVGAYNLTLADPSNYYQLNITGVVSGTGTITTNTGSSTTNTLGNTGNTFNGKLVIGGGNILNIGSIGSGTNVDLNTGTLAATSGAAAIALGSVNMIGSGTINNNATSTSSIIAINSNLAATAGSKTLTLGGSNTGNNVFAGNIGNGSGTIAVAKADAGKWLLTGNLSFSGGLRITNGTLALSGTNTFTGTIFNGNGQYGNGSNGTLIFRGAQAVPPGNLMQVGNYSTGWGETYILDDNGGVNNGTINFTNTLYINCNNQTGQNQVPGYFVGNNNTANGGNSSGTTTGVTMMFATLNVDLGAGNGNGNTINGYGANGYKLGFQQVNLPALGGGSWTAQFKPTTAALVLGSVIQANGSTGAGNSLTMALDGTASGNLVTGAIKDALDYTSGSNANATKLTLTKLNTSTWTLSGANSYTGATTVLAGSLVAGTDALVSSNGAFGNASSAIVLGNGSTGASDAPALLINGAFTVGRAITVDSVANTNAYNAIIGSSNTTGTATYTGNITLGTNTQYTATLQAATGGTVEFKTGSWTTNNKAIAIGSSGNTGTVKVSSNIATSGGIKVNYGTLALGASNALASTTPVSIGSATLDAATFTDALGTLNATGSAVINLGSGAALAFAASNGMTWAGTLNLTGTFVPGFSLKFGTSNAGLTAIQLGKIAVTGFSNFVLDSNGFLTATPTGGYAGWTSTNGATGQTLDQDHDNDGVPNGIEYFLGGPNGHTTGFTALPGVTNTAGTLSVTWTKGTGYTGIYGTDYFVETSATLNGIWVSEPGSGGQVTDTASTVTYTFPVPLGSKKFARLKVTGP